MGYEIPNNSGDPFEDPGCSSVVALGWFFGSRLGFGAGTIYIIEKLFEDWLRSGNESEIALKAIGILALGFVVGLGVPALIERAVGNKFENEK